MTDPPPEEFFSFEQVARELQLKWVASRAQAIHAQARQIYGALQRLHGDELVERLLELGEETPPLPGVSEDLDILARQMVARTAATSQLLLASVSMLLAARELPEQPPPGG